MEKCIRVNAELVYAAGDQVGESPVWDASSRRLLWVDIPLGRIHSLDPLTHEDRVVRAGTPIGAVALRQQGGLVLAARDGFAVLESGVLRVVAPVEADRPSNRMNDGNIDPQGRFWAGTMDVGMRAGAGGLYRLDPDHQAHLMLAPVSVANGIDWNLDGDVMYFVDSGLGTVFAFDFDGPTGTIRGGRIVCQIAATEGLPDGMTVDAQGFLWVAVWGAGVVRRYAPDGSEVASIRVPATQVTSCAFGGEDLGTLFITTAAEGVEETEPQAGALFACRPGAVGRPPNRFLG